MDRVMDNIKIKGVCVCKGTKRSLQIQPTRILGTQQLQESAHTLA
jgi:hypothetical protein